MWRRLPRLVRVMEHRVRLRSQCCRLAWRRPPYVVADLFRAYFQESGMRQALVIIQLLDLRQALVIIQVSGMHHYLMAVVARPPLPRHRLKPECSSPGMCG